MAVLLCNDKKHEEFSEFMSYKGSQNVDPRPQQIFGCVAEGAACPANDAIVNGHRNRDVDL